MLYSGLFSYISQKYQILILAKIFHLSMLLYRSKDMFIIHHANKCSGQSKNNTMGTIPAMTTNRHTDSTFSFLVVGHTKFSPDWANQKALYRWTVIGNLMQGHHLGLYVHTKYNYQFNLNFATLTLLHVHF